jgi:Hypervirulence associated proteins TUDOR domain
MAAFGKSPSLKQGDQVSWKTSQGPTTGRIRKKLTKSANVKGHPVAASLDNPEYLVETEKTHKLAAHKPQSLKRST